MLFVSSVSYCNQSSGIHACRGAIQVILGWLVLWILPVACLQDSFLHDTHYVGKSSTPSFAWASEAKKGSFGLDTPKSECGKRSSKAMLN